MAQATRSRASVRSPPLLLAKLHPPARRDQTVVRERLVESLRASARVKLTVVAAPAGCGKTTLLGTWRDAEKTLPVGWLTLDEGDNDPVVLWLHVLEALRRVRPELCEAVPAVGSASRVVDVVVRRLLNELAEQDDVVLILDDFHRLSNGPARDSVAWLIEHAPPTFHVVLGTRSEPSLPLATMRSSTGGSAWAWNGPTSIGSSSGSRAGPQGSIWRVSRSAALRTGGRSSAASAGRAGTSSTSSSARCSMHTTPRRSR